MRRKTFDLEKALAGHMFLVQKFEVPNILARKILSMADRIEVIKRTPRLASPASYDPLADELCHVWTPLFEPPISYRVGNALALVESAIADPRNRVGDYLQIYVSDRMPGFSAEVLEPFCYRRHLANIARCRSNANETGPAGCA